MSKISLYLKIAAFILLIFIWDIIFINYRELTPTIPIHFDLSGTANRFGPKITLWFLAGVATFVYLLLFLVAKNPKTPLLNIPENFKKDTKKSELIVNILNFLTMLIFAVITYESVATGLGTQEGLSSVVNYLLGLMLVLVVVMVIVSKKNMQKEYPQNTD